MGTATTARLALAALLLPALAWAAVGKVSALDGTATRAPRGGAPVALRVGGEVELGDTLVVAPRSHVKLTLTDASVLVLGERSELTITEARFEGQERRGFAARLGLGKLWTRVTRALGGSEAKFEITTDRAVAGVRGTIFRVDAVKVVGATTQPGRRAARTVVRVMEGRVAVQARVKRAAAKGSPRQQGPRTQVAGPSEISAEQWEQRFVELQAHQQVEVGEELWQESAIPASAQDDELMRFVKRHGG